ncbi:MAG TPA: hypothetical protein DDW51_05180 [Cyanobacteria bacterium UBA11367]|nr:hypothetical protein [Cyanobacteria bacterium UBA11367]HCA93810.1 hypothetical protein [Cyanobacteria bacterium UBA9226]
MLKNSSILNQRYQLETKLGQNAGRQTWLGLDISKSPPEPVIVKLLAFNPQIDWEEIKLFEREAQVLKHLNHPRIPKYRDYFSLDSHRGEGLPWFGLVQDYINGDSLQNMLDIGKRFTEKQVRQIAISVLEILTYLHQLSPPVFHRDIKPSNLILAKDGQVYLVDFGAVQDRATAEGVTFTVVGTSGYVPPEQLWGKAVPASDLYALGATLIHLLTGIPPTDLPQNQMRIEFGERVKIRTSFMEWLEILTEPASEQRFISASQALLALKSGRNDPIRLAKSNQSYRNPVNYRRLAILTLPQIFLIGIVMVFGWSSWNSGKKVQYEARQNIEEMNLYQEKYYEMHYKFDTERNYLMNTTELYYYNTSTTSNEALNHAWPVDPDDYFKSYFGGVFVDSMSEVLDSQEIEIKIKSIICEADDPGNISPPQPSAQNSCPQGSKQIGVPRVKLIRLKNKGL